MIEIKDVSKQFGKTRAVDHVSFSVKEENVFGLIGTNGAGKSTMLRMLAGVLKPDAGLVLIDGMQVYDNVNAKKMFFFIGDEPYFFSNATPRDMEKYYSSVFSAFSRESYYLYLANFGLDSRRKINTFSKGMKKQLALICGICSGTKYLFCDETFDGLDPVMRQAVKSLFANDMAERNLTPIIASHNLRELEDICDHVGILHKGGILLSKDLDDMKLNLHKIQCVLRPGMEAGEIPGLEILKTERRGSLSTITVRGTREEVEAAMRSCEPVFFEAIPLSLEEIFISETEVAGYDVKKLIF